MVGMDSSSMHMIYGYGVSMDLASLWYDQNLYMYDNDDKIVNK